MSMASSMVRQVTFTTPALGDSLVQGFNLRIFCGVGFSWPLGPLEIETCIPDDHVSGLLMTKPWLGFQQLY
jgi:hypothetical protein